MTRIISVANQKGGVGKTTTAINLSAALSHYGKSVLLIDLDPQGNAGRGFGIDITALKKTVYDVLTDSCDINETIITRSNPSVDILPSNLKLASLDAYLSSSPTPTPFFLLSRALASLKIEYDFIVIDCPPSLGLLNLNGLCSSDSVIIPVQCEYFAMEAIAPILASIKKVQENYNKGLRIEGFLLTMYDSRTTLGTEIATAVRGLFKENTFHTTVPRNISIPEASSLGKPVTSFRPSSQGALAYFNLSREVLDHE